MKNYGEESLWDRLEQEQNGSVWDKLGKSSQSVEAEPEPRCFKSPHPVVPRAKQPRELSTSLLMKAVYYLFGFEFHN